MVGDAPRSCGGGSDLARVLPRDAADRLLFSGMAAAREPCGPFGTPECDSRDARKLRVECRPYAREQEDFVRRAVQTTGCADVWPRRAKMCAADPEATTYRGAPVFEGEAAKNNNKMIMDAVSKMPGSYSDPLLLNNLMHVARQLHDSIDFNTFDDERRQLAVLLLSNQAPQCCNKGVALMLGRDKTQSKRPGSSGGFGGGPRFSTKLYEGSADHYAQATLYKGLLGPGMYDVTCSRSGQYLDMGQPEGRPTTAPASGFACSRAQLASRCMSLGLSAFRRAAAATTAVKVRCGCACGWATGRRSRRAWRSPLRPSCSSQQPASVRR